MHIKRLISACCLLLAFSAPAFAYSFSPSVASLSPSGKNSSRIYSLSNEADKPVAVEITISRFKRDETGKAVGVEEDAMQNFMVYPARVVLMPKETRLVQVAWIGPGDIKEERGYHILAKQVPVPLGEEKEDLLPGKARIEIDVLFNYRGIVYITPKKAKPKVVVESVAGWEGEAAELTVTCANRGTGLANMQGYCIRIAPLDKDGGVQAEKAVVVGHADHKVGTKFLPGDSLKIVLPWPQALPKGPVKVEIEPDSEYTATK